MMKNHMSVIFLPTNKCNVDCTYCFEDKTDDRMTHEQLSAVMTKLLSFMEKDDIGSLTLHWQGGELMTLPISWFEKAHDIIGNLAAAHGRVIKHGMQTNMIAYTPRWDEIIKKMFGGSVGTSMDYPNLYRRLNNGSAEDYTRIWRRNVKTARENGIGVGVISVANQATLETGAERFYSFFIDELGIDSFQINTPFPGGEMNETKRDLALENEELSRFFIDLTDIWLERGLASGVSLNPIDELIKHFLSEPNSLPCIWQSNCADEFISIDARGYVAQCDCWVTSYPEYFFGNIFEHESLGELLRTSPARREFIERPAVIIDQGCIECDYLSICHGGCPVRTYTKKHTLNEKDPYCSFYKALFRHTERAATQLAERRFLEQQPKNILFESARQKVLQEFLS